MLPTSNLVDEVQFAGNKQRHKSAKSRFICTGDLTPYLEPVAQHSTAKNISEIIDSGFRYRETEYYKSRMNRLELSRPQKFHARRFETRDDIEEYFEYKVHLIRSIAMHGCLSRRDLTEHHRRLVPDFSANRAREHDIGCAIGPNGETWMFRTGHHRLHIAKHFGIEQIPVEVHFVHWEWIVKCCKESRVSLTNFVNVGSADPIGRAITTDD